MKQRSNKIQELLTLFNEKDNYNRQFTETEEAFWYITQYIISMSGMIERVLSYQTHDIKSWHRPVRDNSTNKIQDASIEWISLRQIQQSTYKKVLGYSDNTKTHIRFMLWLLQSSLYYGRFILNTTKTTYDILKTNRGLRLTTFTNSLAEFSAPIVSPDTIPVRAARLNSTMMSMWQTITDTDELVIFTTIQTETLVTNLIDISPIWQKVDEVCVKVKARELELQSALAKTNNNSSICNPSDVTLLNEFVGLYTYIESKLTGRQYPIKERHEVPFMIRRKMSQIDITDTNDYVLYFSACIFVCQHLEAFVQTNDGTHQAFILNENNDSTLDELISAYKIREGHVQKEFATLLETITKAEDNMEVVQAVNEHLHTIGYTERAYLCESAKKRSFVKI